MYPSLAPNCQSVIIPSHRCALAMTDVQYHTRCWSCLQGERGEARLLDSVIEHGFLPPLRSSSILPKEGCSVGSTKVRTMPGLLARAVLQRENIKCVSLARRVCPSARPGSRPRPTLLPASPMDIGLCSARKVKIEDCRHVVEVYAPGHTRLWIRGPEKITWHQTDTHPLGMCSHIYL